MKLDSYISHWEMSRRGNDIRYLLEAEYIAPDEAKVIVRRFQTLVGRISLGVTVMRSTLAILIHLVYEGAQEYKFQQTLEKKWM